MFTWIVRHRRPLAPAFFAALLWLLGVAIHRRLADVETKAVLAWFVIAFGIQIMAVAAFVRGRTTRKVANVIGVATWAWLLAAHAQGATAVAYPWFILSAVFAGLWWTNQVVITRVRLDAVVESWPRIAQAAQIAGSVMPKGKFRATGNGGWEADIVGPPSSSVIGQLDKIAAEMALKTGRLTGRPTEMANTTRLVYEGERVVPETTTLTEPSITSITESFLIGHRSNGTPVLINLFRATFGALHMLIAGTNGSGKSNFINLLVAHVVKAKDAVAWFIDLKGGAESGPWTRALGYQAVTKEQAVAMVAELKRIVDERGQLLTKLGFGKCWKPSAEHPVICLFLDESAELTADIELNRTLNDLKSIARRARALGVLLVLATQLPTNEALGSTQIKAQFQYRVCFRMQKRSQAQYVLNNYQGVDVSALPGPTDPGFCFMEIFEDLPFMTGTLYIPDDTVDGLSVRLGPTQPDVDPDTLRGMSDAYGERDRDPLRILSPQEYEEAFASIVEAMGNDGEPVGEPVGEDSPDGDYWGTLVVDVPAARRGHDGEPEDEMDEKLRGRPRKLGDDIDRAELYDGEFPELPPMRLSDLPPPPPRPEKPKLSEEDAEAAFWKTLDDATRAGTTATPAQLQAATTWSRATVHRRIDAALELGTLERPATGEYISVARRAGATRT